jgi:hypothetical protein
MKRYLCVVRLPMGMDTPSFESERETAMEDLRRGGRLLAESELQHGSAGVVVRVRAGHVSVTVAPPEDGSALDAAFILQARDLNEAIQLAARHPGARHGVVEIHPLRSID